MTHNHVKRDLSLQRLCEATKSPFKSLSTDDIDNTIDIVLIFQRDIP
jgi:hypothetical protein